MATGDIIMAWKALLTSSNFTILKKTNFKMFSQVYDNNFRIK